MYEFIKGNIAELTPTTAIIEAAGVGYLINISLQTYATLENQSQAKLFTHFIVREDAQILYGFAERQERELFRLLISVSGVGGNTARMILHILSGRVEQHHQKRKCRPAQKCQRSRSENSTENHRGTARQDARHNRHAGEQYGIKPEFGHIRRGRIGTRNAGIHESRIGESRKKCHNRGSECTCGRGNTHVA